MWRTKYNLPARLLLAASFLVIFRIWVFLLGDFISSGDSTDRTPVTSFYGTGSRVGDELILIWATVIPLLLFVLSLLKWIPLWILISILTLICIGTTFCAFWVIDL
jgi:phosphatidylserine synthase